MDAVSPCRPADDNKRVAFLCELALGANASLAAARANLNRGTAYRWKLEDPEFAGLWAEIVASRPRRRRLPARVLARVLGRGKRRETSHLASHESLMGTSPEAAWDNDFGPVFKSRW
jgi:hypothetical protein